ncbi:MAG: site-specific DNA-methyltransferase [Proteobacteria bacterium ST_bin12]|nr:MAG: site-specific DNA-methyltransferase [Proteobacteria bacterium ST_bin12]
MNNNQNKDYDKLDMQSPDLVNQNIEKLAELFPNCVTESANGKAIDFDLLKQELSHAVVEGNKERYRLEWPGKREAIVTANLPTTKTLRPVREDSVNFDNTENIYIEGDNLEVLKLLQESYLGKIKMIYIDPPYNTGNDFVYKDNFAKDKDEELFESGQSDELGQRLVLNPETSGKYHSDWLSMMYPRLKLARNLLAEDGVIFISIDDRETENLKKICNEIFGDNNVEELIWNKEAEGSSGTLKQILRFRIIHETILVCYKHIDLVEFSRISEPLLGKENELQTANLAVNEENVRDGHINWMEITAPNGKKWLKHWKFNNQEIKRLLEEDLIYWGKDGTNQPRLIIPTDHRRKVYLKSIINKGGTTQGRKDFEELMQEGVFSYPKPVSLISLLIQISDCDGILLDFFSGSATSAHSVLSINSDSTDKSKNIKYIQVQLPEQTSENSEAYKAGFKNICEIGKERIRRAAKKIKEETGADIDYGFRVYRLDESNMQDVYYRPQDFDQAKMDLFGDNVKPDRTEDDLLAQVMLDWGLPLSLKIEQANVAGKKVFRVAENSLFACFDRDIDEAFAKEIAKEKPLRMVFKDAGFKDDTAKTNVKQLLKQLSPETEMKVL